LRVNTPARPEGTEDSGFWWSMAILATSGVAAYWLLKRAGVLR
jgi:Mg2+ and Co2+ transporter CorA